MSIISLFQEARAIQHFSDRPVPKELIINILKEAVWAPNHRLREPWRFIFAKDETKYKLSRTLDPDKHKQLQQTIAKAPVCLIVTAKTNKDEHISNDDFAAVCCLIQNIQLLGRANQLGMIWELADYTSYPEFHSLLGIQSDEQIAGVLCLGFFNQLPAKTSVSVHDQIVTL